MPELPEVETIRRQANQLLVGAKILAVEQRHPGVFHGQAQMLVGKKIQHVRRFGKLLILDVSGAWSLAIHLKMTGRLTLLVTNKSLPSHTHVIFSLTSHKQLVFSDSRRFGFIRLLKTDDVLSLPFIKKLGKEPLKDLQYPEFKEICGKTKRPIKTLLLDQQRIAGIGNIYACESLWMAKIHPLLPAAMLSSKQTTALFGAIEAVLQEGLDRGGASDNSYRNLEGNKGEYQDFFKVYMRRTKPCLRCQTPISSMKVAGRGTFFCPSCQKPVLDNKKV